jgi:hypothetical protein
MVYFFFKKARVGCDVPTDEVDVYFDNRDRVAKWSTRTFMSGGCP